jgi:hypothetical protein
MEWISVDEALPDTRKQVLIWHGDIDVGFLGNDGLWYVRLKYEAPETTHWMRITPPEESE